MLPSGEAEIRQKYGVALRKVSAFQYAVFRDGLPIGSLCRLFPEGWYFTNRDIKLPYRDYVTHVDVDGDNDLVTVTIPGEWCEGQIVYGGGTELREWLGPSFSWDFTDSVSSYDKLRVYIAPFGTAYGSWDYDYGNGRYLSTGNIPSGTTFNIDFAIRLESTNNDISYKSNDFRSYSVDGSRATLYSKYFPTPTTDSDGWLNFSFAGDIPSDSDGWFPFMMVYMNGQLPGGIFEFELRNFEINLSISALYRINETTQENNALLREVKRQLAEQGKTMDQILNQQQQTNDKLDGITGYDPVPEAPDWQGSIDELEKVEQDAMDNVQSGMDDAEQVFDSVFNILGDYVQSFAAVSILFETFADIPFFSALLAVSLSLGIVAALLGIGLDAARSSARSSARSTRKARSG